jgi:hypothetical protein
VERESKFLDNCRYIVNNPVEAGLVNHPSQWPWSSFRPTRGLEKAPAFFKADFLLRHFSACRKTAQKMYEDFVLAGVGKGSLLIEAKQQIFLGSDSFISNAMRHVNGIDELNNVPKVQKFADRPSLEVIFNGVRTTPREVRNRLIQNAHDNLAYTQREIGEHLGLHPGYVSRIIHKLRKG